MRWKAARIDEIEEQSDGRCPMRPVRHHMGITAFGVNAFTGAAVGDRLINEHDESPPDDQEELYVVTSGHARFELDGESVDAPAGTLVFAPPGVMRTAFAEEAGTTLLAIGAVTGMPYVAHGWEMWAPLNQAFQEGRYDEVADRARELLADDPPYAALYYNTACAESLAGRKEDAIKHLRRALELAEATARPETPGSQFRELARGDSDFDAIRDDPAFQKIVGG